MDFDILINGGVVLDGTGKAAVRADVGVKGDRIAAIGDLSSSAGHRVIDATGLTVTPGFIDVHSHSDGVLLIDGQHANGIRQGVTTEIIGPDGLSYAPLPPEKYRMYRVYLSGILGLPPEDLDMSSIDAARRNYERRTACNVAMFVGHGPIRVNVAGMRDVPLRGELLDRAVSLLEESLEQGACGFATGLSYFPHSYSNTEELVQLCKVLARFNLPLSIHLRTHNADRARGLSGVEEALTIGREAGIKVHLEHYRTNVDNAGHIETILDPVDRAKREGVDVTLETYPYPVGSSFPSFFFPGPFHEGGPEAMLSRLADPAERARWVGALRANLVGSPSVRQIGKNCWSWIGSSRNKYLEGQLLEDVAAQRGVSVEEMLCEVMLEERLTCGFRSAPPQNVRVWRQIEQDVMELLARDDYMIGSDSIPVGGMVHPRAYGCFPRVLGRLRRRYRYPLEQVVQRVTQNPANRFRIPARGVIKQGFFADITVFDADRITDLSSFEDPAVEPAGVPFVIVNGRIVVDDERCTGVMAGVTVP